MPRWFLRGVLLFVLVFVALVLLVLAHERHDPDPPQARPRPAAVGLGGHLRALQRIASEHGGDRATGSAGERATIAYVAARLRAGEGADAAVLGRRPGLRCAPSGRVGVCGPRLLAAAALVITDSEPFAGSLGRPADRPVVAAGNAVTRHAGERATVVVDAVSETRRSGNVIASDGPSDAGRVTMAAAHLDSVPAGPGLNDNGSGVAALLHVADRLRPRDLPLRCGFWGAEEIGLVGSRRYVRSLSTATPATGSPATSTSG